MKTYFVLIGQGGELSRQDVTGKDNGGDYTEEMIRWLREDHIVLNADDCICIQAVE